MSSLAAEQPGVVNRRILLVTVGFVAAAAVGLVNNFSTLLISASLLRSTLWLVLFVATPIVVMVLLRLFPRTAWAWLLVAGGLFSIPAALVSPIRRTLGFGDQIFAATAVMSPTLLLMGVLAAATWVGQSGFRGLGAMLGAVTVAIPTLGQFLLSPLQSQASRGVYMAISLCGAIGAASMLRFLRGVAETRPDWPLVVVGCTVSLLPILNGPLGEWYAIPALVLILVVVAIAGARPAIGALIIALVATGTISLVVYMAYLVQSDALVMAALIAGFLVGMVGAVSRYRIAIAMAGLALLGVLVLVSASDSRSTYATYAVPLVFLVVAAIVIKTGAVADLLRANAMSPIIIGVVAPLLTNAIFAVEMEQDNRPSIPTLGAVSGWPIVSGVMLLVAAALLPLLKRLGSAAPTSELPVDVPESTV